VISGTSSPYSPAICPPNFSCPEDDGCSTSDGSRWLKLECGADYDDNLLQGTTAASIEACSQQCLSNPPCKALTFVGGKGGGNCYLKTVKGATAITDHTDSE
jgi:hypothetical protein